MIESNLSLSEIHDISEKLKKLQPGFLPFELFYQFNRLKVTVTIEVVPLCLDDQGRINVVLFNRGSDDAWWPNLYHTPGTCLLDDDITSQDEWGLPAKAFERLKNSELKDIKLIDAPIFIDNINHQVRRGPELAPVYIQEVDYDSAKNYLFPVNQLPKNIVDHQISMIQKCAEIFKSQKSL